MKIRQLATHRRGPLILLAVSVTFFVAWLLTPFAPLHFSKVNAESAWALNIHGGVIGTYSRTRLATEGDCVRTIRTGLIHVAGVQWSTSPSQLNLQASGTLLFPSVAFLGLSGLTSAYSRRKHHDKAHLCRASFNRTWNSRLFVHQGIPTRRKTALARCRAVFLGLLSAFSAITYIAWSTTFWLPMWYSVSCGCNARDLALSGSISFDQTACYDNPFPGFRTVNAFRVFPLVRYVHTKVPQVFDSWEMDLHLLPVSILIGAWPAFAFIRGPLRRDHLARRNRCVDCGYDLRANESGVCPECGRRAIPGTQSHAAVS